MRKIAVLAGLLLLISVTARAQDRAEVFGGYSYTRVSQTGGDLNLNGWDASLTGKPRRWFGVTADFAGGYTAKAGAGASLHTFLFGPRFSIPWRISPFGHFLFGAARKSAAGVSDSSFAWEAGEGVDVRVGHLFSIRAIEADFLSTHFAGSRQDAARISTGIVIRF